MNLKNFFTYKNLSRKKTKWEEKLITLDLKIKCRFNKNNFANDLSHRSNYEHQITKKKQVKKWKFKSQKMNVDREQRFFQKQKWSEQKRKKNYLSCRNRYIVLTKTNNNSTKTQKIIDKISKKNCFQNKNQNLARALNWIANILQKKYENRNHYETIFEMKKKFKIIVLKNREDFEKNLTRKRRE